MITRVAILCDNVKHFNQWIKQNELKRGIYKHIAIDRTNFIEYIAFYLHEPTHRVEDKLNGVNFNSFRDISMPLVRELEQHEEVLSLINNRIK